MNIEGEYEVEAIIDRRLVNCKTEYKVKWKDYDMKDATWEPVENLINAKKLIKIFEEKKKIVVQEKEPLKTKEKHKTEKHNFNSHNNSSDQMQVEEYEYITKEKDLKHQPDYITTMKVKEGILYGLVYWKKPNIPPSFVMTDLFKKNLQNATILINFYESKIKFLKKDN